MGILSHTHSPGIDVSQAVPILAQIYCIYCFRDPGDLSFGLLVGMQGFLYRSRPVLGVSFGLSLCSLVCSVFSAETG